MIRLEQMHHMFEACILGAKHGTMCEGDHKKCLKSKHMIILTNSTVAQIIANAVEDS